jgi:hypothetical protein
LIRISLGIGSHSFGFGSVNEERKSLSCERTFQETSDPAVISKYCQNICSEICSDLKSKNIKGKSIAVKIKTDTYDVKSRIRSILDPTWDVDIVFSTAMSIFESLRKEHPGVLTLRLFGVRLSNFKFMKPKSDSAEGVPTSEDDCPSSTFDSGLPSTSNKSLIQPRIDMMVWNEPTELEPCPLCKETFTSSWKLMDHVEKCLEKDNPETVTDDVVVPAEKVDVEDKNQSSIQNQQTTSCPVKRGRDADSDPDPVEKLDPVRKSDDRAKRPRTSNAENMKGVKMLPINWYFKPKSEPDPS